MVFLVFIVEVEGCQFPTTVIADKERTKFDRYIKFHESVLFEFDEASHTQTDEVLTPHIAVLHPNLLKTMFSINDLVVPILSSSHEVVGTLHVKISKLEISLDKFTCRPFPTHRPVWIGHRGAGANSFGAKMRENTIESFNHAMTFEGVAGIELDVSLSKDSELVVYHDMFHPVSLNGRSTKLPISSLMLAEDIRVKFPVPTLEEVLRKLEPVSAGIVIELKYPTNDAIRNNPDLGTFSRDKLVHKVFQCLQENARYIEERWIVVSSFDPDIVWLLHEATKHTNILVVFNTWFGHEHDTDRETFGHFKDPRNVSQTDAIAMLTKFGLGVAFEADHVLQKELHPGFTTLKKPLFSYGLANTRIDHIKHQKVINAFFIDNMGIINIY
jgi:glycerophosphoryl diester phosphodiesterase